MSLSSKVTSKSQAAFQFKAGFSHCISFEILRYDLAEIKSHLAEIMRSSQFFTDSPVIIDLEKIKSSGEIDFISLKELLLSHSIVPIGVRGGSPEQHQAAMTFGLPMMRVGKTNVSEVVKNTASESPVIAKVITQPVRSGMQIQAKTGDLIVTSQISAGAELMAEGHIHVYGVLRGRAIAGIRGNQAARIFCLALEADLIAIAGYYLTRDEIVLPQGHTGPLQIYLQDKKLQIEIL